MSFYLDTSALVPIFIREAQTDAMVGWISQTRDQVAVADLTVAEFRSQLSRRVRKGELTIAQADALGIEFDQWRQATASPLENLPADLRAAARLVRIPTPKLLTPDAIHLATCARLGSTLVTYDLRLIETGRRERVATLSPS